MNQQTPSSESHWPPAKASASPLHLAFPETAKGTARLADNDDIRSIQHPLHKVDEISLRPISMGVLFVAATVQTAGAMPELSCSEPAKLIESALGYAGKIERITIKPLALAGSWQLSGFLHLRNDCGDEPRSTPGREATPARGVYSFDLRKRACALCKAEEDRILNNNHRRVLDGGCDGSSDDGNYEEDYDHEYENFIMDRRNRRWEPLEEQRLLAWRKPLRSQKTRH